MRSVPPDIERILAALDTIWSKHTNVKFHVMNSTIGRRPISAAPMPSPAKPFSEIGVSMIRFGPNCSSMPCETL